MKPVQILLIVAGIMGLISIRVIQDQLFYDPFLNYFHEANRSAVFPDFESAKLILSHFFRFLLNLICSALIIHGFFLNKKWTLQGVIMICIVFAITLPVYLYGVLNKFEIGYLFSFYMRRFVIQPLILLLVIPMFYYRKHIQKTSDFS